MKKLLLFFLLFTAARAAEDDITVYQRDVTNRNQPVTINGTTQAGKALGFNPTTGVLEAIDTLKLGSAGVTATQDGDGGLTLTGNGNGTDEDFTFNLDDTANTIGISSSTGVDLWAFSGIALTATGFTSTGQTFYINSAQTVFWKAGTGSPEAAVTGGIGSLWSRTDGTTDTALYRKETGVGNTGWVAVAAGGGAGSVATDAIWNAAGDLAVGTGANTAGLLTIGTEGQTLAVSAGGTPEWLTTPLLGTAQTFTAQQTFSKAPAVSRTDLAGGTSLTIGTYYYDALTAIRTLTFSGSPAAGNTVSLKLVVTNAPILTIPSCKRAGEANSAITSIQMTNGVHILTWTYINAEWILNDTVGGPLDNAGYAEDAGANDTYTASLVPIPSAYVTGLAYRFKAATANTGAATINFNALGAKTIVKAAGGITTALADNDIRAGQWVDLVYDGTNMQMVSLLGNAPAGSGTVTSASVVSANGFAGTVATATTTPAITLTTSITGVLKGNGTAISAATAGTDYGVPSDTAYDATSWNANTDVPTKNAVRDKIESLATGAGSFGVTVDGGGSVVTAGSKGFVVVPFACTITGWSIVADQSGSVAFDVEKAADGVVPSTSIVASAAPTLTADQIERSTTLTSWTTSVTANDVIEFEITGTPATITRATLQIHYTR